MGRATNDAFQGNIRAPTTVSDDDDGDARSGNVDIVNLLRARAASKVPEARVDNRQRITARGIHLRIEARR